MLQLISVKESATQAPKITAYKSEKGLMIDRDWLDSNASLRRKSILSFVRESCSGNVHYLNKRFFEAYFPGVFEPSTTQMDANDHREFLGGTADHTVALTAGQPGRATG
ncbi:MAG: hypothetical protein ACOYBO_00980 [Azonexus sp.]